MDPESARKVIDQEVLRLFRKRNELSPIYRLPAEVITHIVAQYLQNGRTARYINIDNYGKLLSCITKISSQIRDIVINSPSLWAKISFDWSSDWIELCLNRSKAAPLHITSGILWMSNEKLEGLMQKLSGQEYRLKTLSVDFLGEEENVPLEGSAPQLESFILNCRVRTTHPNLSTGMFSTPMLSLRHVELRRCVVPWTGHILANLTYLCIEETTTATSPDVVLAMLSRNPALQHLSLVDNAFNASPLTPTQSNYVHLPHLKSVILHRIPFRALHALASHIHCPSSAELFLCSNYAREGNPLNQFVRDISILSDDRLPKNLSIQDGPNNIEVGRHGGGDTTISVRLRVDFSQERITDAVRAVPLEQIEKFELCAHGYEDLEVSSLRELLNRCTRLTTAIFYGTAAVDLFSQLLQESHLPNCFKTVISSQIPENGGVAHACDECSAFRDSPLANLRSINLSDSDLRSSQFIPFESYLFFKAKVGKKLSYLRLEKCRGVSEFVVDSYRKGAETVDVEVPDYEEEYDSYGEIEGDWYDSELEEEDPDFFDYAGESWPW